MKKCLNNCKIKRFLIIVLATHLAIIGLLGLDTIGFNIPILRKIVGFIYLMFIPGFVILRVLKLHKLSFVDSILYSVGLSLSFLMLLGFFMNSIYPLIGISKPISLIPLVITIIVFVTIIAAIACIQNTDYRDSFSETYLSFRNLINSYALFLCLLPFLSIFGTFIMNFYNNNSLLVILLVIISVIPIIVIFDKIPKELYPLSVFVIAVSLTFHRSLISMYLTGWDIHHEYYLSNLVVANSLWNTEIHYIINAMLSVVMVAPIFSIVCDINLIWVFKIIYPLLYSFVPVGLYQVYRKQTNDKIGFLSAFFFMSVFTFHSEMLALARQEIAELYLTLLMHLMVNENIDKMKKVILSIIFAFSLIVSHYGLSYIFMFSLIVVGVSLLLISRYKNQKIKSYITTTFIAIYIAFAMIWYTSISSSSVFNAIIYLGNHIINSIYSELLNPESVQGLGFVLKKTASPLHALAKILHIITQFFIGVGILALLLKYRDVKFKFKKFKIEYIIFAIVSFGFNVGGLVLPYFASALNTSRLYHITLFFLAPMCIIGGMTLLETSNDISKIRWTSQITKNSLKILSLFFGIFLLFNTGLIYEITNDIPTSISLNSTIDYPRFCDTEILSVKWLYSNVENNNMCIYADSYRWLLLLEYFEKSQIRTFSTDINQIPENSYLYFGVFNVKEKVILIQQMRKALVVLKYVSLNIPYNSIKIYDSNVQIYYY